MLPSGRSVAVIAIALVAAIAGYTLYAANQTPGPVTSAVPSKFTVNGRTYAFNYTATNYAQWKEGLMNKKVTGATTMLFAFPYSSTWGFWMYNTSTSLDMIWVNATGNSGRVVYVVTSAQPCFAFQGFGCENYTPSEPANYVIEAKAGFAEADNISVGTPILFG